MATEDSFAVGAINFYFLEPQVVIWEKETGHTVNLIALPPGPTDQFSQFRLWLSADNTDIDLYLTDVIWAPQLSEQFIDLSDAAKEVVKDHFPSIIQSQTVDGRLAALPAFTDAPELYYRTDLLDKYGK